MQGLFLRRLLVVSAGAICLMAFAPLVQTSLAGKTNADAGSLALTRPSFLRVAHAEGVNNKTYSIEVNRAETTTNQLTIGSFNQARSANLSLKSGSYFEQARASLTSRFPQIQVVEFQELTPSTLNGVDILFLSVGNANTVAGVPLTVLEQELLLKFVQEGGCAVLLPDNDRYGVGAPIENESLIGKFGMLITGTLFGGVAATVTDTKLSLVTSGPYGDIKSFTQNYPGGITDRGPYGKALAKNSLGDALVVIPNRTIGPAAGPVIVFSDFNTFVDDFDQGFFTQNQFLFLNTIFSCLATHKSFLPVTLR
jgi:hypothetical protein